MPETNILSLNFGSSSLKFGLYSCVDHQFTLLIEGEAEEVGRDAATFWSRKGDDPKHEKSQPIPDHNAALSMALQTIQQHPDAIGQRVVHGGPNLRDHHLLDKETREKLRAAVPFAPLHLPSSLAVIDAVSQQMPAVPQVICLDTAFHKDLPDVAKTLPFSREVRDRGVERYGFHGLSVESIVEQLVDIPERTVVAHLGSGASITALHKGRSIDTSMGMTPTGGIIMGTRSGDVDPGALVYLLHNGTDSDGLARLVDHESGLKGISERSSDVRELTAARSHDSKCDLALRMFAYSARKTIAAMAAALGGLDLLVFTGGIGQHAEQTREEIRLGLSFLGTFKTKVLPAQEDLQIARITRRLTS
jgi:acetate kinase